MKKLMAPGLLACLVLGTSGCLANPELGEEAEALRAELQALPGVTAATLDYTTPVTLDSGKLALSVTMVPEADPESVAEVVATAYAGFAGTHEHEEGDLDVLLGEDTLHLRSFEPVAQVADVRAAVVAAMPVLAQAEVSAGINTQDVAAQPHVETAFQVSADTPTREALLAVMTALRGHADVPHASWRFQAGGDYGWLVQTSSPGWPGDEQMALFDQLSAPLPDGVAVQLYDLDSAAVQVPEDAPPDQVVAMAERHLRLLGGTRKAFYDVNSADGFAAMLAGGDCTFEEGASPMGILGARLEAALADECTKVTHPDDLAG